MFKDSLFSLGKLLKGLGIEVKSFEKLSTDLFDGGKCVEGLFHLKDGTTAKYVYETSKVPNRLIQEIEHNGQKIRLVTNKRGELSKNFPHYRHTVGKVNEGKELKQAFVYDHIVMPPKHNHGIGKRKTSKVLEEYHGETYTTRQDGSIFADPHDSNGTQIDWQRLPIGMTRYDYIPHVYRAGSNPYKILTRMYTGY